MIIRTIAVTVFEQNCRILIDETTGRSTVVDPGGDLKRVSAVLGVPVGLEGAPSIVVEQIVLTHAHIDHAGGVALFLEECGRKQDFRPALLGHRLDQPLRSSIRAQAAMMGLSPSDYRDCPEPDRFLEEGDTVPFGSVRGKILFVPGHAPGHIAIVFSDVSCIEEIYDERARLVSSHQLPARFVISGDTLFGGAIGRTDLPGGDGPALLRSIKDKLLTLPDDTVVLAGHGGNTTIGIERESNPFVGDFNAGAYGSRVGQRG